MKKRSLVFIPILVVAAAIAAYLLLNDRDQYAWQESLDSYLAFLRDTQQPSYHLSSAVPSSNPASFTPQMSAQSYSDSLAFQAGQASGPEFSAGLQVISYPPAELWCVLLKGDSQQQLVYVALHSSASTADWVIHIPNAPWGSPQLESNLQKLGCSFDM